MPIITTTAYLPGSSATAFARSLINDAQIAGGDLLTDTGPNSFLTMQYLNAAYHEVQYELANIGVETFTKETIIQNVSPVISVNPQVQVNVSDGGYFDGTSLHLSPFLPADMLVPYDLWEAHTGVVEPFIPMEETRGALPSRWQWTRLRIWKWDNDAINMLGATQACDLRLRYEVQLPDLSTPSDQIMIRGANNAVGYIIAALFSDSRDAPKAQEWKSAAINSIEQMARRSTRRQQHKGSYRRRPYGRRTRTFNAGGYW